MEAIEELSAAPAESLYHQLGRASFRGGFPELARKCSDRCLQILSAVHDAPMLAFPVYIHCATIAASCGEVEAALNAFAKAITVRDNAEWTVEERLLPGATEKEKKDFHSLPSKLQSALTPEAIEHIFGVNVAVPALFYGCKQDKKIEDFRFFIGRITAALRKGESPLSRAGWWADILDDAVGSFSPLVIPKTVQEQIEKAAAAPDYWRRICHSIGLVKRFADDPGLTGTPAHAEFLRLVLRHQGELVGWLAGPHHSPNDSAPEAARLSWRFWIHPAARDAAKTVFPLALFEKIDQLTKFDQHDALQRFSEFVLPAATCLDLRLDEPLQKIFEAHVR
jgi:hypothetical protein